MLSQWWPCFEGKVAVTIGSLSGSDVNGALQKGSCNTWQDIATASDYPVSLPQSNTVPGKYFQEEACETHVQGKLSEMSKASWT